MYNLGNACDDVMLLLGTHCVEELNTTFPCNNGVTDVLIQSPHETQNSMVCCE